MTTIKKSALIITLVVASVQAPYCPAQVVIHYPGSENTLSERWKWSRTEIKQKNFDHGCWVGYSIQHRMGKKSFIGTFRSDWGRQKPTLEELLTGLHRAPGVDDERVGLPFQTEGTTTLDDEEKEEGQVIKEVGLLFHVDKDGSIDELRASNLSLPFDLSGDPLLWLGNAEYHESATFIESVYGETKNTELKKSLLMALGIHDGSKEAFEFLKGILLSAETVDLREEAAFWLGETQTDDARAVLLNVAQNDKSESVREKAIFSISEMKSPASLEALITIAKTGQDKETRKNAIFWLGQKASEKTVGTLKDVAGNDKDSEVQKSAVFALTQLPDDKGVDALIEIAKHHANPKIRKDAIFWLGQNDDPKALEALIDLARQ